MKNIASNTNSRDTAILLIHCPDRKGILSTVTEFLNKNNGNIVYLDQHVDREEKLFYMRVEWDLEGFDIPKDKIADYFDTLIASKFDMINNLFYRSFQPCDFLFQTQNSLY